MWKVIHSLSRVAKDFGSKSQHFHTCHKHVFRGTIPCSQLSTSWPVMKNFLSTENRKVHINKSHLEIEDSHHAKPLSISFMWLRDHCRCNHCYNFSTNQRNTNILDLQSTAAPAKYTIENDILYLTWKDNHTSSYSLDWLRNIHDTSSPKVTQVLWDKERINSANVSYMDIEQYNTDEGLVKFLTSLLMYGVAFVHNVQPTLVATEKIVQRITHVQRTLFGDMWEFSDKMEHQDTAYSKEALGPHTDNTYFSEAAGLQVFHCLHHDGEGGETLLVDGFYVANCLKEKYPDSFKRLTEYIIESEYLETGKHYISAGPVLRLNAVTKNLEQIRFNVYDRAPMRTVSSDKVMQFYEDYINLASLMNDSKHHWWFKLSSGTILFLNNWRVLHGRAAYTGHRKIAGCYIGYSDWLSKARILGLL